MRALHSDLWRTFDCSIRASAVASPESRRAPLAGTGKSSSVNIHHRRDPRLGNLFAPDWPSHRRRLHAISAAELQHRFTLDVTSEVVPGVTRHFTSLSASKPEAGLRRIYAGQHFRFDHLAGCVSAERCLEQSRRLLYVRSNRGQFTQESSSIDVHTGTLIWRAGSFLGGSWGS